MKLNEEIVSQWLKGPSLPDQLLSIVESRLNVTLPEYGVLAGQSVSSAVMELLGVGRPVYNDADLFISSDDWVMSDEEKAQEKKRTRGSKMAGSISYVEQSLREEDYGRIAVASRHVYTVAASRMEGNLNQVKVCYSYGTPLAAKGMSLINAFDINSTMVGIDLATKKLLYTPAFLKFLVTKQLRVEQMFSPIHSLLRFLQKREDLEVYGHIEGHIELARRRVLVEQGPACFSEVRTAAFQVGRIYVESSDFKKAVQAERNGHLAFLLDNAKWTTNGSGLYGAPLSFGKKYAPRAERFNAEVSQAFDITVCAKKPLQIAVAKGGSASEEEALSVGCFLGDKKSFQTVTGVDNFWRTWMPVKSSVKALRDRSKSFIDSLKHSDIQRSQQMTQLVIGDSFAADTKDIDLALLTEVLNAHEEITAALDGLPLRQQCHTVRTLIRRFKAHNMDPMWGMLRGMGGHQLRRIVHDEEAFNAMIEAHMSRMGELVSVPMVMPTEWGAVTVKELTSGRELAEEGSRMSHCVGGYTNALRNNTSRILHFCAGPKATDCATVEWQPRSNSKLPMVELNGEKFHPMQVVLIQARTFGNQTPVPIILEAEEAVREAVNRWLESNPVEGLLMFVK